MSRTRLSVMVSWFALVLSANAQNADVTVRIKNSNIQGGQETQVRFPETKLNLTLRAMPIAQALRQIGRSSGLNLLADSSLNEDVVLIGVTDISVREICNRLATLLHAQWTQRPSGLVLARPKSIVKSEEEEEERAETAWFSRALAGLRERYAKLPLWNQETAVDLARSMLALQKQEDPEHYNAEANEVQGELEERGASGKIVGSLLTHLQPDELARIPRNQRVAFAVSPTSEEQDLSGVDQDLANEYQQYHRIWVDAVKLVAPGWKRPSGFHYGGQNGLDDILDGSDPPARAVLSVQRVGAGSWAAVELKLWDAKGKLLSRSQLELPDKAEPEASWSPTDPKVLSTSLSLSPDSRRLVDALRNHRPVEASSPLLSDLCTRPEPVDPLSLVPTDALLDLSYLLGKNVMALLPDSTFELSRIPPVELTLKRFLDELPAENLHLDVGDVWIQGFPVSRVIAREDRLSRTGLLGFIKAVRKEGPRIDSMADYSVAHGSNLNGPIAPNMLALLTTDALRQLQQMDWKTLRIYGFLNATQRADILSGKKILSADWSSPLHDEIHKDVFRTWTNLDVVNNTVDPRAVQDIRDEPAEAIPGGLSPDCYLSGTVNSHDTLVGPLIFGPVGTKPSLAEMSPYDLAAGIYLEHNPAWAHAPTRRAAVGSGTLLTVGKTFRLELHVRLAPIYQLTGQLSEFSPTNERVSVDSLPQWLDDSVKRGLAIYKQRDSSSVAGSGATPPPPKNP